MNKSKVIKAARDYADAKADVVRAVWKDRATPQDINVASERSSAAWEKLLDVVYGGDDENSE